MHFLEKIEAPLTLVLSPGASIRENTVIHQLWKDFAANFRPLFRSPHSQNHTLEIVYAFQSEWENLHIVLL